MTRKLFGLLLALASTAACAEVVVGVSISSTGPGASLGVHVAKAIALLPKTIGGEAVRYVVLDDTSDPTTGAKNARRFAVERHLHPQRG